MSSSPDVLSGDAVLRGSHAASVTAASFAVDLRTAVPVDSEAVEKVKAQARTAGYAEGWAQGQRAAAIAAQAAQDQAAAAERAFASQRTAALQTALSALAGAADRLDARVVPTVDEVQDLIVSSAVALAKAILGRELAEPEGRGADAVRRAMGAAPSGGEVTVRLHPDDYRNLNGSAAPGDYKFEGRPVALRPDPGLQPGDAVAEVGATTVDATIAAAMARALEVLA